MRCNGHPPPVALWNKSQKCYEPGSVCFWLNGNRLLGSKEGSESFRGASESSPNSSPKGASRQVLFGLEPKLGPPREAHIGLYRPISAHIGPYRPGATPEMAGFRARETLAASKGGLLRGWAESVLGKESGASRLRRGGWKLDVQSNSCENAAEKWKF